MMASLRIIGGKSRYNGMDHKVATHIKEERMSRWIITLFAGVATLYAVLAHAQGIGNRPVRIIVPVAPGGPSDTAVRLMVPKLGEGLRRTIVVDNRPSNNG